MNAKQNNLVVTVQSRTDYGYLQFIARVGEYQAGSRTEVYWPHQYLYEIKPSEYYQDLRTRIHANAIGPGYALDYETTSVDLPHAKAMVATLNRLQRRFIKLETEEGYVKSWGDYVLRLARILRAEVLIDRKSFGLPHQYGDWLDLEYRHAAHEINAQVARMIEEDKAA